MAEPLFDTDIIVDWLSGRREALAELGRYPRHRISRISWAELLAMEPLESRDRVEALLAAFDVIEVDARVAAAAADLRHATAMRLADALVLATAQVHGAILITRNVTDFPAAMPGIRVPYTL